MTCGTENKLKNSCEDNNSDFIEPEFPMPPLDSEEIKDFEKMVALRIRSKLYPSNITPLKDTSEIIWIEGETHLAAFSIEELEQTDAIEQVAEESSGRCWYCCLKEVYSKRREFYEENCPKDLACWNPCRSRAWLNRKNLAFEVRLLEYLELISMTGKHDFYVPLLKTFKELRKDTLNGRAYFQIRTKEHYKFWLFHELMYFLLIPNIVDKFYNVIPFLKEREMAYFCYPTLRFIVSILKRVDSQSLPKNVDDLLVAVKKECDFYENVEQDSFNPRKPGVILRDRIRRPLE